MRDHEIIGRFLDNAERLFEGGSESERAEQVAALQDLLGHNLADHFAYEENHIFPALLTGNPPAKVVRLVPALRDEHQVVLEKARALQRILDDPGRGSRTTGHLHEAVVDLFRLLIRHVTEENELFVALLDRFHRSL